jgi:hypothetical protein
MPLLHICSLPNQGVVHGSSSLPPFSLQIIVDVLSCPQPQPWRLASFCDIRSYS